MPNLNKRPYRALMSACVLLACGAVLTGCQTHSQTSEKPSTVQIKPVIGQEMLEHLKAFEKIAKNNGGNRAVGTAGGQASAKYIVDEVKKLGLTAQLIPFENREKTLGQNIIVELKGQSKDNAIIIGGHYDSVLEGPGINDNGSGVAVLLDLIKHYQANPNQLKHTLYFAFWDSEEVGVAGSQHFVKNLTEQQLSQIKAYINVDMVGTKNPNIMISDADYSSLIELENTAKANGLTPEEYGPIVEPFRQIPMHEGSKALEVQLTEFFAQKNLTIKEDLTTLTASDTLPFLGKVPVASMIFFNEQEKGDTLEFAPCYHQACDTLQYVDPAVLQIAKEGVSYLIQRAEQ